MKTMSKILTFVLCILIFLLSVLLFISAIVKRDNIEQIIDKEVINKIILADESEINRLMRERNIPLELLDEVRDNGELVSFYRDLVIENLETDGKMIEFDYERLKGIVRDVVTKYDKVNEEDVWNNIESSIDYVLGAQVEVYESEEVASILLLLKSLDKTYFIVLLTVLIVIAIITLFILDKSKYLFAIGISLLIPSFILYFSKSMIRKSDFDIVVSKCYEILNNYILTFATIGLIFLILHFIKSYIIPFYKKIKYKYYGIDNY